MALEDIFRAYDIRGKTDTELTPDVMADIGRAFAHGSHENTIVLGHDVRVSSPKLAEAFAHGVREAGVNVVDAGFAPYGAVLFHAWQQVLESAFVTASHLPKEWNGVKFAHGNGIGYTEEENMHVEDEFFAGPPASRTHGDYTEVDVLDQYKQYLRQKVDIKNISVLMDCGNGSSCVVAPDLFRETGINTDVMNGEPDGTFPNRESDVTKDSLKELRERVDAGDYHMGVAYDGDGDRVAVVDDTGRLLSSEQLAAAMLQQLLEEREGPVVANVECSRLLEHVAQQYDRDVVRVRVGHTYLFKAMKEHDAVLGVEKSGHMGVPHVLPLDDGIAASLYAAEVVSKLDRPLSAVVNEFPNYYRARIPFNVQEAFKFDVIHYLQDELSQEFANTNTMDGIRIDFEDGWVLIRASNTSPKIRLTVESRDSDRFQKLQNTFNDKLREAILEYEQAHEREMGEDADAESEDWDIEE